MQEYVSDYIGKPLLTRSGERAGYVRNVQTDARLRAVRNLECCDEEEEEFVLPLSAVAQAGKDAVIVKSLAAQPCKNCRPAPFGAPVYDETGAQLGTAADFLREGRTLTGILLSDGSVLPADRLAGLEDAAMISLSSPAKRAPARRARAEKPAGKEPAGVREEESGQAVAAAAGREAQAGTSGMPRENVQAQKTAMRAAQNVTGTHRPPARRGMRAGSSLLTGKVLPQDLTDVRGNVLARAGTVVTAETISRAMAHDKLFALTLLCCGNAYER